MCSGIAPSSLYTWLWPSVEIISCSQQSSTYIGDVNKSSPLLGGSMRRRWRPLHLWAFLLQHTHTQRHEQKTQDFTPEPMHACNNEYFTVKHKTSRYLHCGQIQKLNPNRWRSKLCWFPVFRVHTEKTHGCVYCLTWFSDLVVFNLGILLPAVTVGFFPRGKGMAVWLWAPKTNAAAAARWAALQKKTGKRRAVSVNSTEKWMLGLIRG